MPPGSLFCRDGRLSPGAAPAVRKRRRTREGLFCPNFIGDSPPLRSGLGEAIFFDHCDENNRHPSPSVSWRCVSESRERGRSGGSGRTEGAPHLLRVREAELPLPRRAAGRIWPGTRVLAGGRGIMLYGREGHVSGGRRREPRSFVSCRGTTPAGGRALAVSRGFPRNGPVTPFDHFSSKIRPSRWTTRRRGGPRRVVEQTAPRAVGQIWRRERPRRQTCGARSS